MQSLSNDLIGVAGVHCVVSELSMRGIIALPTVRNTAGIDIICANKNGSKTALIQVKCSGKKVNFWPMPTEDKILSGKNCHYVFMRYLNEKGNFEIFLVEGRDVKKQVAKNMEYYRKKGRKEFPYFEICKEDERYYRRHWMQFRI